MDFKKCFVPSCSNTSLNSKKIFISVPKIENIRKNWCKAVGRSKVLLTSSAGVYCCEDHFNLEHDSENWTAYKLFPVHLKIKSNVVPHQNLSGQSAVPKGYSQLPGSAEKRKLTNIEEYNLKKPRLVAKRLEFEETLPSTSTAALKETMESPKHMDVSEPPTTFALTTGKDSKIFCHKKVQVNIKPNTKSFGVNTKFELVSKSTSPFKVSRTKPDLMKLSPPSTSTVSSNKSESDYIISSSESSDPYEQKKAHLRMMSAKNINIIIKEHSRFYLGLAEDVYFMIKLLEEEANIAHPHILIILKKIRLNDQFFTLSIDFGLSVALISRIFNEHLTKLACYFKSLIIWPSASEIRLNLPIPFRYRYSKVQSIIDCLEIEIEQPSNSLHQALTWSNYKKANTLKYLISSTPDGLINFISEGFGGRITDQEIVEASGYLNIVPPCDVMADRGFKNIAGILKNKNCNLVRPPSVQSGTQSSKEQVKESKRIASLRIHIERVIRRLREFAILDKHACLNHQLVPKTDYLITIAYGIVNLQGSLIQ